jgi:hypothetical protein
VGGGGHGEGEGRGGWRLAAAAGELVLEVGVAEEGEPAGEVRVEELGEFLEGVEELVGGGVVRVLF